MSEKFFRSCWFWLLLGLLVSPLLWARLQDTPPKFLGFETLNFPARECRVKIAPRGLPGRSLVMKNVKHCAAEPVQVRSRLLRLSYWQPEQQGLIFTLRTSDGRTQEVRPLSPGRERKWLAQWIDLSIAEPGEQITLELSTESDKKLAAALRHKIDFFAPRLPQWFQPEVRPPRLANTAFTGPGMLYALGVGLCVAASLLIPISRRRFSAMLLLLIVPLHFRPQVFFYWDEWSVLENFMNKGLAVLAMPHSEHVIPLFFMWWRSVVAVFGEFYEGLILLSLLLHVFVTLELRALLTRVAERFLLAEAFTTPIALVFALSAMHSEVLQWSFEQCILLSALALLIAAQSVLVAPNRWNLFRAGLAMFTAPLLFGGGLIVYPIVVLLLVLDHFAPRSWFRANLRHYMRISAVMACTATVTFFIYVTIQANEQHHTAPPIPQKVFAYTGVGTQVGTVARSFGFYPYLNPTRAPKPPTVAVGVTCSVVLFVLMLVRRRRRERLALWVCGQLIMITALLLPALGRATQFGVAQALSPRYQYFALFGFCLLLLSLVPHRNRRPLLASWLCAALAVAYVFVQFSMLNRFQNLDLSEYGWRNRVYIGQLVFWQKSLDELRQLHPERQIPFDGREQLFGLYPFLPRTLIRNRHPDELYKIYQWLRADTEQAGLN